MRLPPRPLTALAAGLLALTACAPTFRLAPHPAPGQEIIWLQGHQAVVTGDGGATLTLHALKDGDPLLKLVLTVRNLAWPRLDVVPTAITVTRLQGAKASPLTVWDPLDYVERQQRLQAFAMGALAVANVLAATQDGQRTRTTPRARTARKRPQPQPEASTSTTYDPALAALQLAQREREFKELARDQEARNAELDRTLLKATTLRPGQSVSGQIFVEFEDADGYQVSVPLGHRTHTIGLAPVRRR